jgi:hypothetical protein
MVMLTSGQPQALENNEVAGALNADCTNVREIASTDVPENPVPDKSEQSKRSRGGKRPGAGRKPNLTKRLLKGVTRDTLIHALDDIEVGAIVADLLRSKREIVRIQTLNFVFDRIFGKPKQDVSVSGGLVHTHTRDPFLASLPKEALEALARSYDEVVAKYAKPVVDVAQDGPQNQIESKPAAAAVGNSCRNTAQHPQTV